MTQLRLLGAFTSPRTVPTLNYGLLESNAISQECASSSVAEADKQCSLSGRKLTGSLVIPEGGAGKHEFAAASALIFLLIPPNFFRAADCLV